MESLEWESWATIDSRWSLAMKFCMWMLLCILAAWCHPIHESVQKWTEGRRAHHGVLECCSAFSRQLTCPSVRNSWFLMLVCCPCCCGAECWPILMCDGIYLHAFHHWRLRAILGVPCLDQEARHIRNADIRQRWGDFGTVTDMLLMKMASPMEWSCGPYAS